MKTLQEIMVEDDRGELFSPFLMGVEQWGKYQETGEAGYKEAAKNCFLFLAEEIGKL